MNDNDFIYWQTEAYHILDKYADLTRGKQIRSQRTNFPVLKVDNKYSIFRIIGLIKSHYSRYNIDIYFRGQNTNYTFKQLPSLFRKTKKIKKGHGDFSDLKFGDSDQYSMGDIKVNVNFIGDFYRLYLRFKTYYYFFDRVLSNISRPNSNVTDKITNNLAIEPILQHYGYNTRWLDIVDNLDIGLWFATVDYTDSIEAGKTIPYNYSRDDNSSSGYLFIYGMHTVDQPAIGVREGEEQRLVDLRQVVSDKSLRPLVQHGFSFTNRDMLSTEITTVVKDDLKRYLLCVIEIDHELIQEYLFVRGNNTLDIPDCFEYDTIFPNDSEDDMADYICTMSEYTEQIMNCLLMKELRPSINLNSSQTSLLDSVGVSTEIIDYFRRTNFRDSNNPLFDQMLTKLNQCIDFQELKDIALIDKLAAYNKLIKFVLGRF